MQIRNRITELLGVEYPIVQAPWAGSRVANWPRQFRTLVAWALSRVARAAYGKDNAVREGAAGKRDGRVPQRALYFGGDMEASIALSRQVAGRIDAVNPVAKIIAETIAQFEATIGALGRRYA